MIWKDKVKTDKLSETIQNAYCEMFRGTFDEIKELDEEYIYASGIHSGDNTDRLLSEARGHLQRHSESTAANSRQNNYHFNVQLNNWDPEDEKPQLLLSDIYENNLAKSEYESGKFFPRQEDPSDEESSPALKRPKQEVMEIMRKEAPVRLRIKNLQKSETPLPESFARNFQKQGHAQEVVNYENSADDHSYLFAVKSKSVERIKIPSSSIEKNAKRLKKLTSHEKLRSLRVGSDPKFAISFTDNLKANGLQQHSLLQAKLANSFKKDKDLNGHTEASSLRLGLFKNLNQHKPKNPIQPSTPSKMSLEFSRLSKKSEDKGSVKGSLPSTTNVFSKVQELIKRPGQESKTKTPSYRSLKKNSFIM
jgi:hypothetical protein